MNIVLLDVKKQKAIVYSDNGKNEINFKSINSLKSFIGKDDVLYIKSASKTKVENIINLVSKISKNKKIVIEDPEYVTSNIGDINIKDMNVVIPGNYTFVPLAPIYKKFGKNIFNENPLLKSAVETNKIRLLTRSELAEVEAKRKEKYDRMRQKEDESMSSVLVPGDVKAKDYVKGGASVRASDDPIEIDLDSAGSFKGSNLGNEGSLLPEDRE
jgi:hypothetical protein